MSVPTARTAYAILGQLSYLEQWLASMRRAAGQITSVHTMWQIADRATSTGSGLDGMTYESCVMGFDLRALDIALSRGSYYGMIAPWWRAHDLYAAKRGKGRFANVLSQARWTVPQLVAEAYADAMNATLPASLIAPTGLLDNMNRMAKLSGGQGPALVVDEQGADYAIDLAAMCPSPVCIRVLEDIPEGMTISFSAKFHWGAGLEEYVEFPDIQTDSSQAGTEHRIALMTVTEYLSAGEQSVSVNSTYMFAPGQTVVVWGTNPDSELPVCERAVISSVTEDDHVLLSRGLNYAYETGAGIAPCFYALTECSQGDGHTATSGSIGVFPYSDLRLSLTE